MNSSPPFSPTVLCGQSDLGRAADEVAECLAVEALERNLFEIRLRAPRLAALAAPGEFAQVLVDPGPLLRRPFSVSRTDRATGMVGFYLGAVGEGSGRLRGYRAGDRLRILGPLGQGFSSPTAAGRSVLLAGGLGAAPFPLLIERLVAAGEEVVWVNGARTAAELYPDHLLPSGLASAIIRTEDGSRGELGLVTAGLATLMRGAQRLYACGSNAMLAAVARGWREARSAGVAVPPLEVSIEAPMGCGIGTCLGCAIPLLVPGSESQAGPLGLCCRQGPVLKADALDWDRLLRQPAHLE